MTRVTSIGLPRKSFVASAAEDAQAATAKAGPSTRAAGAGSPPPAKKGKKRRGQPRDGKRKREGGEGGAGERNVPSSVGGGASSSKGWGRDPELASTCSHLRLENAYSCRTHEALGATCG